MEEPYTNNVCPKWNKFTSRSPFSFLRLAISNKRMLRNHNIIWMKSGFREEIIFEMDLKKWLRYTQVQNWELIWSCKNYSVLSEVKIKTELGHEGKACLIWDIWRQRQLVQMRSYFECTELISNVVEKLLLVLLRHKVQSEPLLSGLKRSSPWHLVSEFWRPPDSGKDLERV